MKGFEKERAAARRAVELLRLEPVMAENFGAKPHGSQVACTEEERGSNAYLAVLGSRYGFVAPSGKSVTEEEFDAARARGIPVLVFTSREDKDAQQEDFIRRIGDYNDGYFYANYSTPQELQDAIVQALKDLVRGRGEVVPVDRAASAIEKKLAIFTERRDDTPSLVTGFLAADDVGEVISPRKLGDAEFQDELRKLLLFGKAPKFFDSKLGTETDEGVNHLQFKQLGGHREEPQTSAAVFADASLATFASLENERTEGYSLFEGWVIDRALVEARLLGSLQLASSFYRMLDDRGITEFYVWAALHGVGQRHFGEIPNTPVNSMSMPSHNLGPTVWIPTQPCRMCRQQLEDGSDFAADVVERVARMFKAANAYFAPNR